MNVVDSDSTGTDVAVPVWITASVLTRVMGGPSSEEGDVEELVGGDIEGEELEACGGYVEPN